VHEVNSNLVVGENNGVVNAHLGEGLHLDDNIADNSYISFTSHHDVVEVHAIGLARPKLGLGVGSSRSN